MNEIVAGFALIAVVLLATPLVSGLVDRSPLSFAFLFLLLGLAIGEGGLSLIEMDAHAPVLEIVATLTLADAVLLRPLPFPDGDRLVTIYEQNLEAGVNRFRRILSRLQKVS